MAAERRDEETRELRLEGIGLIVTGGVFIAFLAGAYYLGRWVERQAHPTAADLGTTAADGPLAGLDRGAEPPIAVDVDSGSDIFDSTRGGDAEPSRQAATDPPRAKPAAAVATAPPSDPAPARQDGKFFVQVFAGRDRESAETLVDELRRGGYGVTVVSERDAGGAVFKVRVGGYATRDDAVAAAQTLTKAGYSTWVTSPG